jgi:hypothetical protein
MRSDIAQPTTLAMAKQAKWNQAALTHRGVIESRRVPLAVVAASVLENGPSWRSPLAMAKQAKWNQAALTHGGLTRWLRFQQRSGRRRALGVVP